MAGDPLALELAADRSYPAVREPLDVDVGDGRREAASLMFALPLVWTNTVLSCELPTGQEV